MVLLVVASTAWVFLHNRLDANFIQVPLYGNAGQVMGVGHASTPADVLAPGAAGQPQHVQGQVTSYFATGSPDSAEKFYRDTFPAQGWKYTGRDDAKTADGRPFRHVYFTSNNGECKPETHVADVMMDEVSEAVRVNVYVFEGCKTLQVQLPPSTPSAAK